MVKNLVKKSDFADIAGVSAAAVTKACAEGRQLFPAWDGKRLDTNHPAAIKYVEDKTGTGAATVPAPGIDPLYASVVEYCAITGKISVSRVQNQFKIGYARAKKIVDTMDATGMSPERYVAEIKAEKPPTAMGGMVAKDKKKYSTPAPQSYEVPDRIEAYADMTLREIIQSHGTDLMFVDWLKALKEIEVIRERRIKNSVAEGELVSRKLVKIGVIEPLDSAHIKLLTDGAKTISRRAVAMHEAKRPLEDIEKFVADQIGSFIRPVKDRVARAFKNV